MNNKHHQLSTNMSRVERVHFVGIGGVGMCGIAEMLHGEGYQISGSDMASSRVTDYLISLGIEVYFEHSAKHVEGADVLVYSSAVSNDNVELIAAREKRIPILPRAAMLAELMRFRYGIAIAGTHGKTTTTSLVSNLLTEGGLDPSFVVGGKLNNISGHARLGKSPYFVVEADESDASFLFLKPMMAVVTNIDADHMETYAGDLNRLKQAFVEFLHHIPFYGTAVVCVDNDSIRRILPEIQRPTLTYGFSAGAQYRAVDCTQNGLMSRFTVHRPLPHTELQVEFKCPGAHNVLNALAAIAIATELGLTDQQIVLGLRSFEGVGRRFQILGERNFEQGRALLIDDYGHHPEEIRTTINAFRSVWPNRRLLHVFQPHRYSRTKALFKDFVEVLSKSDQVLLLDVYSAGEEIIPGVTSEYLANAINKKEGHALLVTEQTLEEYLNQMVLEGDGVLLQGAGSIGRLASSLMPE